VSQTTPTDGDDEGPERVVTFGGSSKTYHRIVRVDGQPRPACAQRGANPFVKERAVIDSHYDACVKCFPRARREGR